MYTVQSMDQSYWFIYRHTSFYYALFYCTSQILCFLQIEGLWWPCIKQVYWCPFSNSICSLCVSVSHFGNSCNISNFFIIIIFIWWSMISDLWCYYCKKNMTCSRFRWWLHFLAIKYFLIKVCMFFFRQCNCTLNRLQDSVVIAFICTGKQKICVDLLYCGGLEPNPQELRGRPIFIYLQMAI